MASPSITHRNILQRFTRAWAGKERVTSYLSGIFHVQHLIRCPVRGFAGFWWVHKKRRAALSGVHTPALRAGAEAGAGQLSEEAGSQCRVDHQNTGEADSPWLSDEGMKLHNDVSAGAQMCCTCQETPVLLGR